MSYVKWENVSGWLYLETYLIDGICKYANDDTPVPKHILEMIQPSPGIAKHYYLGAIIINFESSGYDDPGIVNAPPERCYPPERLDEREIVRVDVELQPTSEALGMMTIKDVIPSQYFGVLQEEYSEEIDKEDLEWED